MSTPDDRLEGARERIQGLLEDGDARAASALAVDLDLHASDLADLFEQLPEELGVQLLSTLPSELASEALAEMEEGEDRADLLAALSPQKTAELLAELADDDAADLMGDLEPGERRRVLDALPAEDAGDLIGLLRYDEESAGGLMTTELVAVEASFSAAAAIDQVRTQGREIGDFYTVFVVDAAGRLQGTLRLDDLITADPESSVQELVEVPVATVHPEVDQEEVGRLISRYNLAAIPVVSDDGVLLGRITFDDVIDAIEEEQTEDILRLAGLGDEGELRYTWTESVRARLPWLFVNLGTAALASSVVYYFSETIESVVILAAIMPIVAGLGGNAGTQALAVTVRSIALDHPPGGRSVRPLGLLVGREIAVGLINGAVLGLVVAMLAALLGGDRMLGGVVWLAMWGNLVVAGFLGSFVPTVMDRLGLDPAVSSSMFVTPFTDLCGFLFLLTLGSALLL
ncbi:MAG TPA: magnesium transporter [Longimicrobiales bacterium]|nr:magnesium transporter [Longimicrobiales bacterium]